MNRIDMVNAALVEVGLPPTAWEDDLGRIHNPAAMSNPLAHRAAWMARLAVDGPDAMTSCSLACSLRRPWVPCITVSRALAGMTCGRENDPTTGGLS